MVNNMDEERKEIKVIRSPLPPAQTTYEYETFYKFFEKTTTLAIIEE